MSKAPDDFIIPAIIGRGRIIKADRVPDEDGRNHKRRYVIVLQQGGDDLHCVAITTHPRSGKTTVSLPTGPHAHTNLDDGSVAVCEWRPLIGREDVVALGGFVPNKALYEMTKAIRDLAEDGERPSAVEPSR